jgi:N-acetylneuraminate synthase
MKTYIIAEIGINHNQSLDNCHALITASAQAGCDAVKLQLFRASSLYPRSAGDLDWKDGEKQYSYNIFDAVSGFETPVEWLEPLSRHCKETGLELLASVFDERSLQLGLRLGLPAIKLASSVVTHLPLLRSSARSGVPLIMSVGGASLGEIEKALEAIKEGTGGRLEKDMFSLLHCSLQYPTALKDCNLGAIKTLAFAFPDVRIGYSDHSEEPEAAPYQAVRLGAEIVEKHITLDRSMPGPDHFFALDPAQLARMVAAIRKADTENAAGTCFTPDSVLYGSTRVECTENQLHLRNFVYPTLFSQQAVKTGERIKSEYLEVLRPGKKTRGIGSSYLPLLRDYAVPAARDLGEEESFTWDCLFTPVPRKRTILLRADAHPAVGTGDLVSFIHLSRMLEKQGWDCHFYTRATVEAEAILYSYGISQFHMLSASLPLEREVELTAALACYLKCDATIMQVTDRPASAYGAMQIPGLKGCVSFEKEAPFGFDFVWSWDVNSKQRYDQALHPNTRFFLGAEYVILPPQFFASPPPETSPSSRERLLVVMGGGSDASDITRAIALRLKAIGNPLRTTFIAGAGYHTIEELKAVLADAPFEWEVKRTVADMYLEYQQCDVCIAAGGLTASELAYLQKPALLFAVHEPQIPRCEYFQEMGWGRYMGTYSSWSLSLENLTVYTHLPKQAFQSRLNEVISYINNELDQTL